MVRAPKPTADPYRVLGIAYGAGLDQIKAAHRRLAKLYHPDGGTGDERLFLAVSEAYQLLSDPVRRGEWDRRHAPGPVRADSGPRRSPRGTAPRPDRGGGGRRRGTPRAARPTTEPGQRTHTWSAEHVPWWEEFRPRGARSDRGDDGGTPSGGEPGTASAHSGSDTAAGERVASPPRPTMDFDVFDRSSGAAWSMAARQHFRQANADLPSRGAWRYRGTQVVTGAEARKVAEEEAAADDARRRARRPSSYGGDRADDGSDG